MDIDLSNFKQSMTSLLKEDKLQEFLDKFKQMKLVQNQLKVIAPIECNTCGILKPRHEYQNNGLKKCKDCLGLNKRKHNKKKQREKVDITIKDIHTKYLLFHKYIYSKQVKEGWVRKLIHKTGDTNNIDNIRDIINTDVNGIDWFADHLHKHYMKQDKSDYYKYYYFFNDMIQQLQYKNDKKETQGLEKYLKQYAKSILKE